MPYFYNMYDEQPRPRHHYLTEAELLEIANKIRAAGGGDPLEAFFPSYQGDENQCLIANALNFGCKVQPMPTRVNYKAFDKRIPTTWDDHTSKWVMEVPTAKLAKKLADALGWEVVDKPFCRNLIILPKEVGNTALAFDEGRGWTKKYAKGGDD